MRVLFNTAVAGLLALAAVACSDDPVSSNSAGTDADAAFARSAQAEEVAGNPLFRFERMRGNQGPFVGAAGAIRGVGAGGLPWVLEEGEARLDADGELRVRVEGLVLDPNDPRVPANLQGVNPVPAFRAILSCLTFNDAGDQMTVNLQTEAVPTDAEGDARIRERLSDIPDPCYAPIVFVTSPGGSWFAVSGF